jgi:hypothetical protein
MSLKRLGNKASRSPFRQLDHLATEFVHHFVVVLPTKHDSREAISNVTNRIRNCDGHRAHARRELAYIESVTNALRLRDLAGILAK